MQVPQYSIARLEWRTKPPKRESDGTLSINARRRITTAIKWLSAISEIKTSHEKKKRNNVRWKLNLATLTFRDNFQNDKAARAMLSRWLEMAKYRWNIHNYIWKAEPQQRGAIHFHCVFNQYIPHTELRYTWNRELLKYGLNGVNDNSTDIHAVENVNNIEAYLTDYLMNEAKHTGRRRIVGKLWGCNHALSKAGKQYIAISPLNYAMLKNTLSPYSLRRIKELHKETIPTWLKFTDYWIVPNSFFDDNNDNIVGQTYINEINALKPPKRQLQLYPIER